VSDLPKSRAKAREVGSKFYFTGLPCKRGHVVERYVSGSCVTCALEKGAAFRLANPEEARRRVRASKKLSPEKLRAQDRLWRERNPEKSRAKTRRWCERNPEKVRAYDRAHYAKNVEKHLHQNMLRKTALLARRPRWLSSVQEQEIAALYVEARRLSQAAGEPYHVDHIVPLRGKTVSGLHVPWNLQVIPGVENLRKRNKLMQEDLS
jgi:hypothetical protein